MSDLAWLTGDPVASYAHAERMLGHARRAGSAFDAATALDVHGLVRWSRGRARRMRRSRAAMRSSVEARVSAPPS